MCFSPLHRLSLLGLLLVLSACGGASGGGDSSGSPGGAVVRGGGFAPSTGPGDTQSYVPADPGDQWLFNASTTDPNAVSPTGIMTLTVNGTIMVKGATATVFHIADSTNALGGHDQYLNIGPGGVTVLGDTDPSDSSSQIIFPYVRLLFPVQLGPVSDLFVQNLRLGTDASGNPITLDLTQRIANADFEAVDVPAGSFPNALKQTTTATGAGHDGAQSAFPSGTDTTWYVPGVGEVKESSSATGGPTSIATSAELRGYIVNGQKHGFMAASDLVTDLVAAGCEGFPFAPPAVGTDGTNFLVVYHSCDSSSAATWNSQLIAPDGRLLGEAKLSPPVQPSPEAERGGHAIVAFDGTNFLVIYEGDDSAFFTGRLYSVVVSPRGIPLTTPTPIGEAVWSSSAEPEALAFDGTRYLLIYDDASSQQRQLSGVFLSPSTGQPLGSVFAVTSAISSGESPALGFDGTNYLAVWVAERSLSEGLYAERISPQGDVLDPTPIHLVDCTHSGGSCDLQPTLAFGTNYLVAYRDPRGQANGGIGYGNATISAARISRGGTLLDGSPTSPGIVVTSTRGIVTGRVRSVFFDGAYLLVWEAGSPQGLWATRVTPAGKVPAAWTDGFSAVAAEKVTALPGIAANGGGALLAWLHEPALNSGSTLTALRAMFIYPHGP